MKTIQENSIECLIISFAVSFSASTFFCFKFGFKFGKKSAIKEARSIIKNFFVGTVVLWVTTMLIIYSSSCEEPYCVFVLDKRLFKQCCDGDLF